MYVGQQLPNATAELIPFAEHVQALLPFAVRTDVLAASATLLAGHPLESWELKFWARRLAAHRDQLAAGQPVAEWLGLTAPGWAPVEIIHTRVGYSTRGREGWIATLRVLDGVACPLLFEQWNPERFDYVLAKQLGLPRLPRELSITWSPSILVGMRFLANLRVWDALGGPLSTRGLQFRERDTAPFRKRNIELFETRLGPCPIGVAAATAPVRPRHPGCTRIQGPGRRSR